MSPDTSGRAPVIVNRRARHDYHIDETYQAGLVLTGAEVKSVRAGRVSLAEAYARIENGEVWIHNMHIAPYGSATHQAPEPLRPRKLLLRRAEIVRLAAATEQRGYTLVPLKLYFSRGYAKLDIGVGRGKQQHDKRRDIAARDAERDIQRALSGRSTDAS